MVVLISIMALWLLVVSIQLIAVRKWIKDEQISKEAGVPSGHFNNKSVHESRVNSG